MSKHSFPDLALRDRIQKRREGFVVADWLNRALRQIASHPQDEEAEEALQRAEEARQLKESVEAIIGRDEDGFVTHLKMCSGCRREVGKAARLGARISARVLAAAGIEVLN